MESTDLQQISASINENYVDLRKIIQSKNPKLSKWIPDFVLFLLKKLLHLKEVNGSIFRHKEKFGVAFAKAIINEDIKVNIEIQNPENMPDGEQRPMIVANHPLGAVDGMALISIVGEKYPDILFPVNDLLLNLPGLKPIFVPINKFGRNAQNKNKLEEAFASESALLYFPAGLCSRKQKGEIKDLEWKKTFLKKAIEYQRNLYPVYVEAKNSNLFYNLANFRKKLGIKANIELILLPREMYKQEGKTIRLVFGTPIPYTTFDKSKTDNEWALSVRNYVYELKKNAYAKFNKH